MSMPTLAPGVFEPSQFSKRHALYAIAVVSIIEISPSLFWPSLADRLLASNFLPHLYCYLGKPGLVWTHVVADSLMGLTYVAISANLARTSRYELVRGKVDLSALAREILSELQEAEPERRVKSMIAPDLIAEGDRTLLRVVLENLRGNA